LKSLFTPVGDETDESCVAFTPVWLSLGQPENEWHHTIEAG
jgi:hypothetical protein